MKAKTTANKATKSKTKANSRSVAADTKGDWRAKALVRMRALIQQADPEVVEEVKWRKPSNPDGVPVWFRDGIICTGETYKDKVKLTFAKGAALEDPAGLFNAGFAGNTRRAIDLCEEDELDDKAFTALVLAAVTLNTSGKVRPTSSAKGRAPSTATRGKKSSPSATAKLLAGGNPQIANADGDAPVQAYIAAMPGWKRDAGRRLDALIARTVPDIRKAVKWNSPFYGIEG